MCCLCGIDGRMPNTMGASRLRAPQHVSASARAHAEAIDVWVSTLRTRFNGAPWLSARTQQGPLVFALRTYDLLILFPSIPDAGAVPRSLDAQPGKDDPTDAALQLALLLTHRDKLQPLHPPSPALRPRAARRTSSPVVVTQYGLPIGSRAP